MPTNKKSQKITEHQCDVQSTFSHTEWLTTKQAAAYAQTAISTFRTWDVSRYRPSKHNLYRKSDIDAYIEQFAYRSDAALSTALAPKRQELALLTTKTK